ncbi:MAG TPA: ATP-binding cassette domain-containing protein [Streptosporangiaceae bacterium]|nr:ATP-binding cassette domain-containing protein [Streptosporangiaceae bacterium]
MTDVVLDRVTKVYPGGTRAVHDLRLHIRDGELFVLLGPSGCGKSTILRMIAGLEMITSGELWLGGVYANELGPRERNVAMVFQNGALYPHRSVRGNLSFPLELSHSDPVRTREKVVELAKALGIDSMLDRFPGTLSGGQRQRVAMGRAVIREPAIFLMDEPLSNLDASMRSELRMEIGGLVRSLGVTTLYVTHDQTEALTLADRMAILRDGVLQDVGTPQQLYADPATMFVAAFLSSPPINLLRAIASASQDEGIILDFGTQRLVIPWTDPRASSFMAAHGTPVVVGIRSDALTPVLPPAPTPLAAPTPDAATAGPGHAARPGGSHEAGVPSGHRLPGAGGAARPAGAGHPLDTGPTTGPRHAAPPAGSAAPAGSVLTVRLREFEFHGHEWLAYAEARIPAIDPSEFDPPARSAAPERPSAAERLWERLRGRRGDAAAANGTARHEPTHAGGHGHHRRSDLLFRVASSRGFTPGQELQLVVDLDRVFVFGQDGRRLDPVRR